MQKTSRNKITQSKKLWNNMLAGGTNPKLKQKSKKIRVAAWEKLSCLKIFYKQGVRLVMKICDFKKLDQKTTLFDQKTWFFGIGIVFSLKYLVFWSNPNFTSFFQKYMTNVFHISREASINIKKNFFWFIYTCLHSSALVSIHLDSSTFVYTHLVTRLHLSTFVCTRVHSPVVASFML